MNKNLIEKIAPQLTELMIKKMETLTEEWRKPWIADLAHGLPRNLRGTPYRGGTARFCKCRLFFSIPQNAPRKKKTLAFYPRWV